ncbi:MAG: hypothetical protein ACOX52_12480 [Verrucomicrobiota bacterium]
MPEACGHRPDVVRNGALLQASPPGNGCRSVRSVRSVRSWSEIEIEIDFGCRSNFAAEFGQHRNNTVALPGFSCPNPIPRPFDTDTDSDPDPELALPPTCSDKLWSGMSCHRGHREHRGFPSVPPDCLIDGKRM